MVAADDAVPRAVAYAGSMFLSMTNGLRLATSPAIPYWMIRITMVMMNASTTTRRNVEITSAI